MARLDHVTLVTGAGGVLGRAVVDTLTERGMAARGLGRQAMPPGFPVEWIRLETALQGVRTILHCASNPRKPEADPIALGRLVEATRVAGTAHLIYVGIAGIERAASRFLYYAAKLQCEQALASSFMPHTILRATQFCSFIVFLLRRLDAKVASVASFGMKLQSVAIEFVASRLVHCALAGPAGRTPDVYGPDALGLAELARFWLRAQGRRTPVISLPLPIQPFTAFAQLEQVSGDQGGLSWRDWLASSEGRVDA